MKLYIFCPMIHGSSKNYKKYTHFFENLTYFNSDLYCLYNDKTSMKLNIMWFKLIWNRAPFFPGKGPILVFRFSDINCQSIKITPSQVLPEKRMKNLISPSLSEVSNGCYGPTSVKMQLEHDNPLINPNSLTLMFRFRFRTLYLSGRSLECLELWKLWSFILMLEYTWYRSVFFF